MFGDLYTEEEVKEFIIKSLMLDSHEVERFFYPDGTTSGFDEIEFENWFNSQKKKQKLFLKSFDLTYSEFDKDFLIKLDKAKNQYFKFNNRVYVINEIKEEGHITKTIKVCFVRQN